MSDNLYVSPLFVHYPYSIGDETMINYWKIAHHALIEVDETISVDIATEITVSHKVPLKLLVTKPEEFR